jgi:hypothetical protein
MYVHTPFALFFAVLLGIHLRKAQNWQEHLVLSQDWNPVHFGRLALDDDMPAADDSEYGENPRRYRYVCLAMYLPTVLARLGIPVESAAVVHVALAYPLLALSLYGLTFAATGSAYAALLGVLLFALRDFSFARLNRNLHITLNQYYSYNDLYYSFCGFAMWAALLGRPLTAAVWTGLTVLCHPMLGANLAVVVCGSWAFSLLATASVGDFLAPLGLLLACLALAFAGVRLATKDFVSCNDPEAQESCLRVYPELTPHALTPVDYYIAMAMLLIFLGAGLIQALTPAQGATPGTLAMYAGGLTVFLAWAIGAYWLFYTRWLPLYQMTAPGKALVPLTLLALPPVAQAWAGLLDSVPLLVLVALAAWRWYLEPGDAGRWFRRYWLVLAAGVGLSLVLLPPHPLLAPYSLAGRVIAPAFLAWAVLRESLFFFKSPERARARAQLDIARQVRQTMPAEACFLPYNLTEDAPNLLWKCFAFRTFARRGYFTYWCVFRNAYFDSLLRYQNASKACAFLGIDLWTTLRESLKTLRASEPLHFFTGIKRLWPLEISPCTPLGQVRLDLDMRIRQNAAQPLPQFMRFARKMKATHLLVSLPPGKMVGCDKIVYTDQNNKVVAAYPILLRNEMFAVIAVR